MRLLLDIGNTTCRRAIYDGASLHHYPVFATTTDYAVYIPSAVGENLHSIVISSVRDEQFNQQLADFILQKYRISPDFAHTQSCACGITTRYEVNALGVDRFLGLIGAWHSFGEACIVVDCGTAVTMDVIDAKGVHLGGLIMPGLTLLKESLCQKADKLSLAEGNEMTFPLNTQDAIDSGCRKFLLAAIIETIADMRQSKIYTLIASGGDGAWLTRMQPEFQYHPNLVIEGLALFSDNNTLA